MNRKYAVRILLSMLVGIASAESVFAAQTGPGQPGVTQTSNASASVKPRLDHSANRYAHGNQTLSGSRLQHNPVILHHSTPAFRANGSRHHEVHHLILVGKETKATKVAATGKATVRAHIIHGKRERHHNGDDGSEGGGNYAGANGDSGGGGESAGAISTSSVNIPLATSAQARSFWNAVHGDFNRWNTTHDGRLTVPQMSRALRNPDLHGNKAAALSALLVTMKQTVGTSTSAHIAKYWSLDGLQKIVDAAEQTNRSRLINRYAQHTQALQDKQPSKMPLFGQANQPVLDDLHRGPADNHAFVAAAAGLATLRPSVLRSMIKPEGKGTFTVHLPNARDVSVHLTEGDVAEFSSTGRSVLWLDVLQKAHEELVDELANKKMEAGSVDKARLPMIDLLSDADAAQVVTLLTHHEVDTVELAGRNPAEISSEIKAALDQKRVVLLQGNDRTDVVLGLDPEKQTIQLWNDSEEASVANAGTDKSGTAAKQPSISIPIADVAARFTSAYIETDKETNRDYADILSAKSSTTPAAQLAAEEAEDAYLAELRSSGITVRKDADGKDVIVMDEAVKAAKSLIAEDGQKIVDLTLDEGSALVAHEEHVRVKTKLCEVHVAPNAAAYIINLDGATAVYNLSDMRSGEVLVKVGNGLKDVRVPLGQEIVLTKDVKADFEKANPDNLIAHRNSVALGVIDGISVFRAEFSFTSLLDNAEGFEELCASNDREDKRLVTRLIKTAAIMVTLRPPFDDSAPKESDAAPADSDLKSHQDAAPSASADPPLSINRTYKSDIGSVSEKPASDLSP